MGMMDLLLETGWTVSSGIRDATRACAETLFFRPQRHAGLFSTISGQGAFQEAEFPHCRFRSPGCG